MLYIVHTGSYAVLVLFFSDFGNWFNLENILFTHLNNGTWLLIFVKCKILVFSTVKCILSYKNGLGKILSSIWRPFVYIEISSNDILEFLYVKCILLDEINRKFQNKHSRGQWYINTVKQTYAHACCAFNHTFKTWWRPTLAIFFKTSMNYLF